MQAPAKRHVLVVHVLDLVLEKEPQGLNRLSADPDRRLARQFLDFRGESLRLLLQLGALLFGQATIYSAVLRRLFSLLMADPPSYNPSRHWGIGP